MMGGEMEERFKAVSVVAAGVLLVVIALLEMLREMFDF